MDERCESEVHDALFEILVSTPGVLILSWSPPNAKAYRAPNLILPKLVDGVRKGSDRVDAVFSYGDTLFLIEVKCRLSESADDVSKLERIRLHLSVKGVLESIRRQGVDVGEMRSLAVGVAVRAIDTRAPAGCLVFGVGDQSIHTTLNETGVEFTLLPAIKVAGRR